MNNILYFKKLNKYLKKLIGGNGHEDRCRDFGRVATSNTKLDISLYLFFFINFFFFLYFILSQSIHFCHKYIHYL